MPLTNRDAQRLFKTITATDGYAAEVAVDGLTKVINKHYHIPPQGRIVLARNHAILQPIIDGLSKAHDALIRELAEDTAATRLPPELSGDFNARWNEILDEEIDVKLVRCKQKVLLDPSACDMPPTLIASLLPLLQDLDD